jgi:iron complex outermembrane receptor protein
VTGAFRLFLSDYDNYISLRDSDDVAGGLTVAQFTATNARFHGGELEVVWTAIADDSTSLRFVAAADCVHARDTDADTPLARTPPGRLSAGVQVGDAGSWELTARLRHAMEQNDVAPGEEPTAAWTSVDLLGTLDIDLGSGACALGVGLLNVFDELGYDHTSYIKPWAPIAGRHLELSLVASF